MNLLFIIFNSPERKVFKASPGRSTQFVWVFSGFPGARPLLVLAGTFFILLLLCKIHGPFGGKFGRYWQLPPFVVGMRPLVWASGGAAHAHWDGVGMVVVCIVVHAGRFSSSVLLVEVQRFALLFPGVEGVFHCVSVDVG